MIRKRSFSWPKRIAALLLLTLLLVAGWVWWQVQHWQPPQDRFPVQGVLIGARDGAADFNGYKAVGASFVYLEASAGARGRDGAFARNLPLARESALRVGALHHYDPCIPAERQAANFVTIVPRDAGLLPPAIALDKLATSCPNPVSEAAVESELTTFLNQVEGHVGQPAVLKISPQFEEHYGIASRIERNLWLDRDWFEPDYAGRPWTIWTANSSFASEASDEPLRWLALRP